MTDGLNTIESLPDISFIDGLTLEDIQSRLLTDFVDKYREVTGKKIELSKSDPNRIILLGCAWKRRKIFWQTQTSNQEK